MPRPNCYECIHRRNIPGDAHSSCHHPEIVKLGDPDPFLGLSDLLTGKFTPAFSALNIQANPHGVNEGWFVFPLNFDPVWLENCDGFTKK